LLNLVQVFSLVIATYTALAIPNQQYCRAIIVPLVANFGKQPEIFNVKQVMTFVLKQQAKSKRKMSASK